MEGIIIMAIDVRSNKIGTFKSYDIQVMEVKPNDVILLHISPDMDLYNCEALYAEVKKEFTNNTVLIVNKHILEGISVLRKGTTEVNLIENQVDVNKIFDEIMKGQPNDFLH
jgi:hypothetical protein